VASPDGIPLLKLLLFSIFFGPNFFLFGITIPGRANIDCCAINAPFSERRGSPPPGRLTAGVNPAARRVVALFAEALKEWLST
jgi:hypothetical protein